ncbi:MAG: hypothetical protein ACUVTP_00735 [Candidatus Fervidibacter sp.]|uniref:hypothetical protein n=1 Tax=Candidatus Fervidibacter sp. TaxID=3100871 RepID=UPI00404A50F4
MSRRRRLAGKFAEREFELKMPLWVQVVVAVWMVGILIWFFSDFKIQQWLEMMLADLFGR